MALANARSVGTKHFTKMTCQKKIKRKKTKLKPNCAGKNKKKFTRNGTTNSLAKNLLHLIRKLNAHVRHKRPAKHGTIADRRVYASSKHVHGPPRGRFKRNNFGKIGKTCNLSWLKPLLQLLARWLNPIARSIT